MAEGKVSQGGWDADANGEIETRVLNRFCEGSR